VVRYGEMPGLLPARKVKIMPKFVDAFRQWSYKEFKAKYPLLQESVYNTLAELSPTVLAFEVANHKDTPLNWNMLDQSTYDLVLSIMTSILSHSELTLSMHGDSGVELTEHDIGLSYLRFRELLYTKGLIDQNIIKETPKSDGSVDYMIEKPIKENIVIHSKRKHWARIKNR
jgi:hypothetical protein